MMKRVIAILAVSAIVTTAVYAQAAVAGLVETRFSVLRGNLSEDDGNLYMGGLGGAGGAGAIGAAWIQLSGTNPDGTLGGLFRLRNTDIVRRQEGLDHWSDGGGPWFHRVFAWWRPIEQMRIWLGVDQDGMFDTAHFAGWGFHQGDNDYMFNHHWDFWRRVFPGNWDSFGMAFSFANFGVDGLAVNLVLPTGARNWPQANNVRVTQARPILEMLAGFRLHSTFAIPGAGTLQFTYNAPGGIMNIDGSLPGPNSTALNQYSPEWGDATNFGQLGLSFLLTALDFGDILFGGAMIIPDSDHYMDLHLGAALDVANIADIMGLRFRVGTQIQGGDIGADPLIIGNIMPIFALGPGSLMFDIGLTMQIAEEFDSEHHLGWSVKPVYRLPLASGAFSIGLHLSSGIGGNDAPLGGQQGLWGGNDVHLHIPMLLRFSF